MSSHTAYSNNCKAKFKVSIYETRASPGPGPGLGKILVEPDRIEIKHGPLEGHHERTYTQTQQGNDKANKT